MARGKVVVRDNVRVNGMNRAAITSQHDDVMFFEVIEELVQIRQHKPTAREIGAKLPLYSAVK